MEENTTYFTLVTVGYKSPLYCDDGKLLYMRYNPVQVTSKDIKNVELAKWLSQEEFLPTSMNDALKIFEVEDISKTVQMLIMSAKVNKATIHCFKTDSPLTEEDCESIVESANFDSHMRMKLLKSRII